MGTETTLPTSLFCSQCGRALSASELVTIAGASVCANCKPAYLRKLQEGAAAAGRLRYKGFWIRFLAKIIDGIVIDLMLFPFMIPLMVRVFHSMPVFTPGQPPDPAAMAKMMQIFGIELRYSLLAMVVMVAYNTILLAKFQTTVGKLAIGAIVVTPEGGRISWGQALGRTLMEIVNYMTLDIGYLIAAFDREKRGLHDRVAGTRVVAK